MTVKRYLIVNADDFGQSPGVNRGVIKAHEQGIVTSASLMVRWAAAIEAAAYSRDHSNLSLGLHVDLGECAYRSGTWVPLYEVAPLDNATQVTDEVLRQLDTFCRLVRKHPTHIDSHQHVHLQEPALSILVDIANRLSIPLRNCSPEVRYSGDFYGQTAEGMPLTDVISVRGLIKILKALMPGFTELGCHPGEGNDLNTMYCRERTEEVKVLCDPRVRAATAALGIELCSFNNVLK